MRQSPTMTTRRGGRPSQVRPRPPSSGRPAPAKVGPRTSASGRVTGHRRVERTRRLALSFKFLFAIAVLSLGGGVLFAATGGLGKAADAIGSTFSGFVADFTATPMPSTPPLSESTIPLLDEPAEPYTNQPTIDLVGSIPDDLVGAANRRIRVYVALGDQDPGVLTQIPVGRTSRFILPGVTLIEGTNAFTATIVGPGGESDPSPVVTYVLDATKPRITLASPMDGAIVNAKTVQLVGRTQPRSQLRVRNATTSASVIGQADASGNFSLILAIGDGTNDIGITAIDPAGNENHLVLAVRYGTGALAASLSGSASKVKLSSLPARTQLTVVVSDPDGRPLEGARVTFTLAAPNVSAVASPTIETGGDGTATWSTLIPRGAKTGQVSTTVIVQTSQYGETTDQMVMTIVK